MDQYLSRIAARYECFAREEAQDKSPLYEKLAMGVAADQELLQFLATLPFAKQQPNLLFAAFRYLHAVPTDYQEFRNKALDDAENLHSTIMTHATQTNEPNRCAVLLPILAQLPQPLAIIEVGAAAGLCLLPDFYAYDYGEGVLMPAPAFKAPPLLKCTLSSDVPRPERMPEIVWRCGLDLNPIDLSDPDESRWLETLIWPGQEHRLFNLRAAIKIAQATSPRVVRGDLRTDVLSDLCAEAPKDATLVIFHTAVLAYIADRRERSDFAQRALSLGRFWISNESPAVFPDTPVSTYRPGRFLLSLNGKSVAWTDPHGIAMDWISAEN